TYADSNEIKNWAVDHVKAVSKVGLFMGHGEFNLFNPNGHITREDVALIISKIVFPTQTYLEQDSTEIEYTDIDDVSEHALDAVKNVRAKGLMKGTENKFRPKDHVTREEACKLIFDILKHADPESTD
ncbi:S-layer homology domain-containing protein, partial [Methanosarcina mazei]|uniref:S-layer homology domain-containing protein n=1 Tax=Methanosarcina mazei TaxID=2209 RepID=UPI00064F55BF